VIEQTATADCLRIVRCSLGGETYALDMACVRGIQRTDRLRPHPGRAGAVGALPTRDGDVPVFGLAELLGRPSRAGAAQQVIVLHDGFRTWGLLVERVAQVASVPTGDLHPMPTRTGAGGPRAFQGILRLGTDLVPLLAPAWLHPDGAPDDAEPPSPYLPPRTDDVAGRRGSRAVTPQAQGRLVLFTTADPRPTERPLVFGVGLARVLEVLEMPRLIPLPGVPPHLLGLATWRNRSIPVIDLASRDGRSAQPLARPEDHRRGGAARHSGAADDAPRPAAAATPPLGSSLAARAVAHPGGRGAEARDPRDPEPRRSRTHRGAPGRTHDGSEPGALERIATMG
jgi:chemotaxis signal transduction protein